MIRHYERQGCLEDQPRADGQHRRYDDEDVQRLLLLQALLAAGLTPSSARRVVGGSAASAELRHADQALARAGERARRARSRLSATVPQPVPVEHRISLAFDLFWARTQIESLLSLELRAAGISSGDYAVLSLVSMERLTQAGLARLVGGAPTSLVRRTRALVDKGWLTRSADPDDARSWVLELTAEGEERVDAALPHARRLLQRLDRALHDQGLDPRVLRSELQLFSAVVRAMLPES